LSSTQLLRLVQYSGLFYARYAGDVNTTKTWLRVSNEMRMARKVLRFLRTIEYMRRAFTSISQYKQKRHKTGVDTVVVVATCLSALSTVLFYIFDHLVFLTEVTR
jgi:hypothetical protein